jgi:hypothetical protein
MTAGVVEQTGTKYHVEWPDHTLKIEAARVSEHSRSVYAEVTVLRTHPGERDTLIEMTQLNLLAGRSVAQLADAVAASERDIALEQADFRQIMKQFAVQVVSQFRTPEPATLLSGETPRRGAVDWLVEPFVQRDAVTVMYGPGGSGKSTIAAAVAITASCGTPILGSLHGSPVPVLVLDWEDEVSSAAYQHHALMKAAGLTAAPFVLYKRMRASLPNAIADIRQEVAENGVKLLVIDSMMLARGGSPVEAETTLELFAALSTVPGVSTLIIDHVAKSSIEAEGGSPLPYGSIATLNSARLGLSVRREDTGNPASDALRVSVETTKSNRTRTGVGLGVEMVYGDSSIAVRELDPDEISLEFSERVASLGDRILAHARNGPIAGASLARTLAANPGSVNKQIRRLSERGLLQKLPNGEYGLPS